MSVDSPYPDLKKRHTMARAGRPWRDFKPPPSGPVWGVIQGFGSYWTLVAAIDLGVFDAVERLGTCTSQELADDLGVQATHLEHLCDALVTFGFLDQIAFRYELTETAERYLCTNGAASMASLVRVAPGPHANWSRLADTVRTGQVATPIEDDPEAFYGPLVEATFVTQHRAATRLGWRIGWAKRPGLRVLDLGAGRAPWAIAILEQSGGSTAVVNDLTRVLDDARDTVDGRGLGDRVTYLPGDFHQVPIELSSFDVVVLGHVCRTEGDPGGRALVQRAFDALRPGGQLILADYFADNDRKYNPFAVQMGLTMLANTRNGRVLTCAQVTGWLRHVGFAHARLLEPIGFQFAYVAEKPSGAGRRINQEHS